MPVLQQNSIWYEGLLNNAYLVNIEGLDVYYGVFKLTTCRHDGQYCEDSHLVLEIMYIQCYQDNQGRWLSLAFKLVILLHIAIHQISQPSEALISI